MATHKERQIVHVKDIFSNSKDQENGPAAKDSSNPQLDKPIQETQEEQDGNIDLNTFAPKVLPSSDSNVYFATGSSEQNGVVPAKSKVRSFKKRQAPKVPSSDSDIKLSHNKEDMTAGRKQMDVSQLSQDRDSASNDNRHTRPKCADMEIGSSDHGIGDTAAGLDVGAFMHSFHKGLKHNPLVNDPQSSQELSSSGVETADEWTSLEEAASESASGHAGKADTCMEKLCRNTSAGHKVQQAAKSTPSTEDEDSGGELDSDDFTEDECTMEFGEEDDTFVESKYRQVYHEYQGEDYAKYMQEENSEENKKMLKKHKKKRKASSKPPLSPTSTTSASSGEKPASKSLKKKLSQVFALSTSERKIKGQGYSGGIHNFSFADSKIGNSVQERDINDAAFKQKNTDKPVPGVDTSGSNKHWWNKDMLSAKTMDSNFEVFLKPKKPSSSDSTSQLTESLLSESFSDGPLNGDQSDSYQDFESYRKSKLFDSKNNKSRKSAIWKKLSHSFRKSDKAKMDKMVVNPLSDADFDVQL